MGQPCYKSKLTWKEERLIFPQWVWMGKLRMGLWTETQKFGGNILVGRGSVRQIVKFQNVCKWFKHGFDSNSSGNDLEVFDLVKDVKS